MVDTKTIQELGIETKFIISNLRMEPVLNWLDHICFPDPSFPFGIVSSIYFDTRELTFMQEKINSDYLKTKVRLRWYGIPDEKYAGGQSFAEVKYRIGSRRHKVRIKTPYSAKWLSEIPLDNQELLKIPILVKNNGISLPNPVFPVFVVSYHRRRFVEPLSKARVCLDYSISVPRVNRMFLPISKRVMLNVAVFEVKSSDGEIPDLLRRLLALGCKKISFSKYFACYQELIS